MLKRRTEPISDDHVSAVEQTIVPVIARISYRTASKLFLPKKNQLASIPRGGLKINVFDSCTAKYKRL
jgi:hypothetical protein